MKDFDLIVIGSGPAGEKAAVKAAYFGFKVALIEKERNLGGAAVQTGTLPSKTLKETALYYSGKYTKGLYGDNAEKRMIQSIQQFLYRQRQVTEEFESAVKRNLNLHQVSVFQGKAEFKNPHEVLICGLKEEVIRGKFILIATGSYPFHPPTIPFDGSRVHDSDSILRIERLPESICIAGAGVIGCEYATIFANLGVPVFLINSHPKILSFVDQEIAALLLEQMRNTGIDVILEAEIASINPPPAGDAGNKTPVHIALKSGETLHVDMFLLAAGRSGNTAELKCEAAGVELAAREFIGVNEHFQSNVPHIYAAGDVVGFPALASTSMDQGRVAVAHMFQLKDLDAFSKVLPYGIYTIPELSMVGLNEEQAKQNGIDYCVGRAHFANTARGKILGIKDGMLKVIFTRDNLKVLGVHILGPLASELIHYGLTLVEGERNLHQVIATVFNYPTFHDLYKYACYDGLGNLNGNKIKNE